jgi:hypothetical protein
MIDFMKGLLKLKSLVSYRYLLSFRFFHYLINLFHRNVRLILFFSKKKALNTCIVNKLHTYS